MGGKRSVRAADNRHEATKMAEKYPEREQFFANRFIRLMVKCCVANEIGSNAFSLLTIIVSTEDASHYRRGVTFYDGQLMPLLGITSNKTMYRIRKRAIELGWLHFEPGHKGKASTYWVLIPKYAENLDDYPTDEGHDEHLYVDSVAKSTPKQPPIWPPKGGYYDPIPIPNRDRGETANTIQTPQESSEAASLAQEFHFRIPGTSKPILSDLVAEFQAKLDWLKATGRNETEHIRKCIVDPKRDKSAAKTIGTMFKFWQFCGLEEKKHERRDNHRRGSPMSAGGGRYEGIKPRIVKL